MNASRPRALILLFAVLSLQLATVGAALGGDSSCLCDARMCVHHPGQHGAAHASAPADASATHGTHVHASATEATKSAAAVPEQTSATHCHTPAAAAPSSTAAPRECSMRGCEDHGEESLPLSPLASLRHPASVEVPGGVSALSELATLSLLDRASALEPPPPRSFPV